VPYSLPESGSTAAKLAVGTWHCMLYLFLPAPCTESSFSVKKKKKKKQVEKAAT
jgi:hypothetical protein